MIINCLVMEQDTLDIGDSLGRTGTTTIEIQNGQFTVANIVIGLGHGISICRHLSDLFDLGLFPDGE